MLGVNEEGWPDLPLASECRKRKTCLPVCPVFQTLWRFMEKRRRPERRTGREKLTWFFGGGIKKSPRLTAETSGGARGKTDVLSPMPMHVWTSGGARGKAEVGKEAERRRKGGAAGGKKSPARGRWGSSPGGASGGLGWCYLRRSVSRAFRVSCFLWNIS